MTGLPPRFGRFEIVRELGKGAAGVVFEAIDPALQRPIALKVMTGGDLANAEQVERMRREGQALARIHHPNVVTIFEAGSTQGQNWIAMELIAGRSLAAVLQEEVPVARRLELLEQVARGVHAAHEKGVLHRDLKPSNVLVDDKTGLARVVDFGLARLEGGSSLTQSGNLLGTPAYGAPELLRFDVAAMGPATDVYSLGAMLFVALTGEVPFPARDAFAMAEATNQATEPPRPSERAHGIPAALDALCMRAMAREPKDRFPSAEAFADAVLAARRGGGGRGAHALAVGVTVACVLLSLAIAFAEWRLRPEGVRLAPAGLAVPGPQPAPPPAPGVAAVASVTFDATLDFAPTQGARGWFYEDSAGEALVFDAPRRTWVGAEKHLQLWAQGGHPGVARHAVRRWKAATAGKARVTGNASKSETGGGNGVLVSIRSGDKVLWKADLAAQDASGTDFDVTVVLDAGQSIEFIIDSKRDDACDATFFAPTIAFIASPAGRSGPAGP